METMHCDYKNKDKHFFERKLESFIKTRSILVKKCRTENENLTNASYHISLHGETHITEEFLVTPILKDVVSCLFYEKSAQAVQSIYLSNNSVLRILKMNSFHNCMHVMPTRCKWMSLQMWMDWQFYLFAR